jgi:hypothetical protein
MKRAAVEIDLLGPGSAAPDYQSARRAQMQTGNKNIKFRIRARHNNVENNCQAKTNIALVGVAVFSS